MDREKLSKIYKPTPMDSGALLPYEWPGSYFIGEEEVKAVTKVLRTRSPFRYYGHTNEEPYSDRLEKVYCERLNRKHALAVNSGTVALSIAMKAMDIGPGDEVIMPGYFWISCPFEDDLVSRSSLLSIPPTLTDEICDHVVAEFQKAAKKYM